MCPTIILLRNRETGTFVGPSDGPQYVRLISQARRFQSQKYALMNCCQGEEIIEIPDPSVRKYHNKTKR